MKKVVSTERIPIKMWLDDLEDSALDQAKNLANLPFSCKHIVLLADSHSGYGMPIGGVLATKDVVVPNCVGKDIACGVIAKKTNKLVSEIDVITLKSIMSKIRSAVPMGLNKKHDQPLPEELMPEIPTGVKLEIVEREWLNARKSLKSMGSSNHFFELQKDSKGCLWIMLHSGSRNLGSKVADHYDKIAKKLNKKWYSSVDPKHDLAFLPADTNEAHNYINEMNYCMTFAQANRDLMMLEACNILTEMFSEITYESSINIHHNYVRMENYGDNFFIHRKGATSARLGEIGIIPGSQGSRSYIVCGKGNLESFNSVSHGAGRAMSRARARNELNLLEEIKKLDDQGIIHGIRNEKGLEEAVGSYKDITVVMKNQEDLIDIVEELIPVACMKGAS